MPKRLVFFPPQALLTHDLPVAPDQIRPVRNVLLHVLVGDDGLAVGLTPAAGAAGKDVLVFVAIEAKCGACCCFVDGFFPLAIFDNYSLACQKEEAFAQSRQGSVEAHWFGILNILNAHFFSPQPSKPASCRSSFKNID